MGYLMKQEVITITLQIGLALALFGTACGGWLWAYRKAIKPAMSYFERQEIRGARMDRIWNELSPNGGNSMFDRVGRMERSVTRLTAIVSAEHEQNPVAKMEFTNATHLTRANARSLAFMGLDLAAARGHGWLNALPEATRQHVRDQMIVAAHENEGVNIHLVRQRTQSDGDSYNLTLYPVRDESDNVGFLGYLNAIGERS